MAESWDARGLDAFMARNTASMYGLPAPDISIMVPKGLTAVTRPALRKITDDIPP